MARFGKSWLRLRLALAGFSLLWLMACTQPPSATPAVVALPPADVYSGNNVEVQVGIVRAGGLSGSVNVALVSGTAGISAVPTATTAAGTTLVVSVGPNVAAGDYQLEVTASSGSTTVSDEFTLTVLGPEPGSVLVHLRSLMLPTPGDISFLGSSAGVTLNPANVVSMVPEQPSELRAVSGEVLVRFREGASALLASELQVAGVTLQRLARPSLGSLQTWRAGGDLSTAQTIELANQLAARPDVLSATPNWIFSAHQVPGLYELQWHYPEVDLHAAWGNEDGTGSGVVVAVLDTGYHDHVDLSGVFLPGYDMIEQDTDPTDNTPSTEFSHGTHVSGTIAMNPANLPLVAGINRGASLVPVKVLGDDGGGTFEQVMMGMVWASGLEIPGFELPGFIPANTNPSRLLNMSLGGRALGCPDEMAELTAALADAGVIVVVSAGNEGQDVALFAPASCPGVITVGATGPHGLRADYSNFGSGVDIVAPGGDFNFPYVSQNFLGGELWSAGVFSTSGSGLDSDYFWAAGTSMAAPHVTGVISLMLAANPNLTLADVREILATSATPITALQCGRPTAADCGAGLLNANLALGGVAAVPWPSAPEFLLEFYPCDDPACLDMADEPSVVRQGTLQRGYDWVEVNGLPIGTYFVYGEVNTAAAHPVLQTEFDFRIVEVSAGATTNTIIEAWPAP